MTDAPKRRGAGRVKPPSKNAHPFVHFISDNNKMSYRNLSKKSGVHFSTVRRWRYYGTRPLLFEMEAALNAMGYDLLIVKKENEG